MTSTERFKREQRGVALRMGATLLVTGIVFFTCLRWGAMTPKPLAERLIMTARVDAILLCWLAVTTGNVARLRFFSAEDIVGSASGSATPAVLRANAILQNTLEQLTLAIPVHVILCALVPSSMPLIIALAVLFVLGRLLFWIGYAKGAKARALGFTLTFYPSVGGLCVAISAALGW